MPAYWAAVGPVHWRFARERPYDPDMSLAQTVEQALQPASRLKTSGGNEANTKALLIEPMLSALGWDTIDVDQVEREYRVYDKTALDYALKIEWAFETAAYSVLSDWPGGGVIGIHGTDEPWLIPGRPSHGCIRVPNTAVRQLARLMPTGTPVRIR